MTREDDVRARFDAAVNMTAAELERWLDTADSKEVGQHQNGGESVGPFIRTPNRGAAAHPPP